MFRALLIFVLAASAVAANDDAAQTILHMLDYVGVDYPEAVADGKVKDADEFKEMVEFTTRVVSLLRMLPDNPQQAQLALDAEALASAVTKKRPAAEVAALAGKLRWAVIGAYKVAVAPKAPPSRERGADLYRQMCVACHGVEGRGDGASGAKLQPAPTNFHDRDRMARRSAFGLYNAITLGIEGTAMQSYRSLAEDDRWALAFHVASFALLRDQRNAGEMLWNAGKGRQAFSAIDNVATLSRNEVKERFGDEAVAMQAYLLSRPESVRQTDRSPIAFSVERLEAALAAYRGGDRDGAQRLAISAYLEGFELAEATLKNIDADLTRRIENEMMALRALITRGAPLDDMTTQHAKVVALLASARERMESATPSAQAIFVSAFLILLREGLEAILVLAAIIAFVVRAGRREALPYVHVGWGAALLSGALTWFAATYVVGISGANREITEGCTALLAAAMLLYVGVWLHSKSYAAAWQRFIHDRVGEALQKKTLWALAIVSFLAVYREIFEIVLFYQALWAQSGDQAPDALVAGIVVALVALAAVGWAILRYSVRLPIGPFFAITSVLIALLGVVFTGNGIAALQEAGIVGVDPIGLVTIPALGIHPTVQTTLAQIVAAALVGACFYLARRRARAAITSRTNPA